MTNTPSGCRWCGVAHRDHMQRWTKTAGWHHWDPPTNAQILARMLARRTALLIAPKPQYHATTAWDPAPDGESADPYCADCATPACVRWSRIQARLNHHRWGAPYRTKHGLNATTGAGSWGGDDTNLPF
jgi:hypothetical protein